MSKVFISHQQNDTKIAKLIYSFLKSNNIESFLDVYDPYMGSYGSPIENYIIDKMNDCSHFMTILSSNAEESWWVPFEIGVATDKDIPIANYFYQDIKIPEYLENWPSLKNKSDLNKYINLIKIGRRRMLLEQKIAGIEPRYSEVFHRELKNKLNQS